MAFGNLELELPPRLAARYMRPVAYASVQGVYAFVFIGVLRTAFDIAVAGMR